MKRLSVSDLAAIFARYEVFSGPEAEQMGFSEYSELYDQFVGEDLPRLMEHVRAMSDHLVYAPGAGADKRKDGRSNPTSTS